MDRPRPVRDGRALSALAARAGTVRPAWLLPAVGLAALVALSAILRTRGLDNAFWIDEGLSAGIASRPIAEIPEALRQDGSPPLYYVLLSLWMQLAGTSDAALHTLSLLVALLTVPAAWWAGRALAGRRAAWIAALLAATNPFLTYHAQEARMYALALLLALVASALLPLAAIHGTRWAHVALAVVLSLLAYTHNWGLYVVVATIAAGLVATAAAELPRREARRLLVAAGSVGLVYLPWLPTLIAQARHTGAPWSTVPGPEALLEVLDIGLGGALLALAVVPAGIGVGRATRAGGRERATVLALAAITIAVPVLGWCGAQISPNWAGRYLAVAVGPLVLLVALGLARAGVLGLAACAVLAGAWVVDDRPGAKSNVAEVALAASPALQPGDTVLVTHPEQIAVLERELPPGLHWWTSLGPSSDSRLMDWRDAVDRLEAAAPPTLAARLLATVPPGGRLLVAEPAIRGDAGWTAPWTRLVRRRAAEWRATLDGDARLRIVGTWPAPGADLPGTSMRLLLYEHLGSP